MKVAIHYSSNDVSTNSLIFIIVDSNFEGAKSVVYFDQSSESAGSCKYLYLQNLSFYHNKEIPIYLSNQNLYISGNIEFIGNVVENGGGIYISNYSNVTVYKSAIVKFTHNRANRNGGVIFLTNHCYSSIVFKKHYVLQICYDNNLFYTVGDQYHTESLIIVTFYNNTAYEFGGDIYVHESNIIFGDTANLKFDGDRHHHLSYNIFKRSIVHVSKQSIMIFGGNSKVTFSNYNIIVDGLIHIDHFSTIAFEGNSSVKFKFISNFADGKVGVVNIDYYSTIAFKDNSTVNFIKHFNDGNRGVIAKH